MNKMGICDHLGIPLSVLPLTSFLYRNIRIITPGFEESYSTSPFHPAFLASLENFTLLRFMDWMHANSGKTPEDWDIPTCFRFLMMFFFLKFIDLQWPFDLHFPVIVQSFSVCCHCHSVQGIQGDSKLLYTELSLWSQFGIHGAFVQWTWDRCMVLGASQCDR